MCEVSYFATRHPDGSRTVARIEHDGSQTVIDSLYNYPEPRGQFDWGRLRIGCGALAKSLLIDALECSGSELDHSWTTFLSEVVLHLPIDEWELTQEAIWDWWLGGICVNDEEDAESLVAMRGGE